MRGFSTVILAAGKGTRMKSELPKVLHRVCGKPMAQHVLEAAKEIGAQTNIMVVGFGADKVQQELGSQAEYVLQQEQLGTGHAVMQAEKRLSELGGMVMVLCGDTPLLTAATLKKLADYHTTQANSATVLTAVMPDPHGYGRIVRGQDGNVIKIVEQKDASAAEKEVREVNTGIYCFASEKLVSALRRITNKNAQGEYYLTDAIEILVKDNEKVGAIPADDHHETLGVNARLQLAEAERILRDRVLVRLMEQGVTVMDPASTFVDTSVQIEADTVLYPFTWLEGQVKIGKGSVIGPHVRMANTQVGRDCTIHFATIADSKIEDGANVGPFVHIRPDSNIGKSVRVGNFVEVKNSTVGDGSKLPHLSYIGDADIGTGVNMGCGTITVNYDGKKKYRTTVENNAFVGCNANLVAPVTVGQGAYVAAGSTITKHVPNGSLAVARAHQKNLDGWAEKNRE